MFNCNFFLSLLFYIILVIVIIEQQDQLYDSLGKDGDIEYENIEKKNWDIETVTSKNCLKVGNYD